MTLTKLQLALVAVGMLLLGFVGALGGKLYTHHSEQHWNMEQGLKQQELLNQQFITAINQLAQKK